MVPGVLHPPGVCATPGGAHRGEHDDCGGDREGFRQEHLLLRPDFQGVVLPEDQVAAHEEPEGLVVLHT